MVEFNKKDLGFIGLYNLCIDNKSPLHDKFEIKCKNNQVVFSQESDKCTLITMYDKTIDEDFQVVYSTAKVNSILNFVPDTESIIFTKEGLSFNKSKYDFEEEKLTLNDSTELLELIKSGTQKEKIVFKNLKNMNTVKSYMGQEGLDTIVNVNDSFVASNEMGISAIIKSGNVSNFNIPEILVNLIMFMKLSEIEIDVYDKFVSTKIGDTYVIVPIKDYLIPNIFADEFAEKYNHKNIITIPKDELIKAVQRIKVVASFNTYSRVFIYCFEDYIEIISKDNANAIETVTAKVDADLKDCFFIISANYLFQIISSLEGKNIIIHAVNDVDAVAVKITDETSDKFFIHCLYPDIEVN